MEESRLHHLAHRHAAGKLSFSQYRQLRRELIEAVIQGRETLREPAPGEPSPPRPRRAAAWLRWLGSNWVVLLGATVALIAGAALLLHPPRPPLEHGTGEHKRVPSRLERAIQAFLERRDWSPERFRELLETWRKASVPERHQTQTTLAWRLLGERIYRQIGEEAALLELEEDPAVLERARDLLQASREFGFDNSQLHRLQEEIRRLAGPGETAQAPREAPPAGTGVQRTAPAQAEAPVPEPAPDDTWLQEREGNRYTLQLFAVNDLARARQILAGAGVSGSRVVSSSDPRFRFRVLSGDYASPGEALEAFDRLPVALREAVGQPVVKRFAELR